MYLVAAGISVMAPPIGRGKARGAEFVRGAHRETELRKKLEPTGAGDQKGKKIFFSSWKLFFLSSFPLFHFSFPLLRFHFSLRYHLLLRSREGQAGTLGVVRRRMRLGPHCRAPPLAVQPSPAPTIRHGGEAGRVGAGARRWADLQAPVTSAGPVCGQANPGGANQQNFVDAWLMM